MSLNISRIQEFLNFFFMKNIRGMSLQIIIELELACTLSVIFLLLVKMQKNQFCFANNKWFANFENPLKKLSNRHPTLCKKKLAQLFRIRNYQSKCVLY